MFQFIVAGMICPRRIERPGAVINMQGHDVQIALSSAWTTIARLLEITTYQL